jgi:hypothetical protein
MSNHKHTIFWANLAAFERKADADELQAHLARNGVEAMVYDERSLQSWWFLSRPRIGVRVQVPSEDFYEVAEKVNADPEAKRILRNAVHCPSCESLKVEYPQMTRRFILPTLIAHLLVLLGIMKHSYYCEDCHYTWTKNRAYRRQVQSKVT